MANQNEESCNKFSNKASISYTFYKFYFILYFAALKNGLCFSQLRESPRVSEAYQRR